MVFTSQSRSLHRELCVEVVGLDFGYGTGRAGRGKDLKTCIDYGSSKQHESLLCKEGVRGGEHLFFTRESKTMTNRLRVARAVALPFMGDEVAEVGRGVFLPLRLKAALHTRVDGSNLIPVRRVILMAELTGGGVRRVRSRSRRTATQCALCDMVGAHLRPVVSAARLVVLRPQPAVENGRRD